LDWCFVQAVLAWVWSIEDGLDESYFKQLTEIFDKKIALNNADKVHIDTSFHKKESGS